MSRHTENRLIVSVGIILNTEKKILVSLRKDDQSYAGFWEFPGGKIEPHETLFEGLKRELHEEIGIELLQAKPLVSLTHQYPNALVELHALQVMAFTGNPFGKENQKIRWASLDEISTLSFPEGNYLIIEKIKSIL